MKKEENQKRNSALKSEYFSRSRSHSPKAYLGCDTCKLKNVKTNSKSSDCGANEKNKRKKSPNSGKVERGLKNQKIKLIDLCDEDKKRLVQLIEELSILAEKNEQLKKKLDKLNKDNQEQQDYILKQANLFLEEKNFYLDEINKYKNRLESVENEMRNKISEWNDQERCKRDELVYLAKALKKSLGEKYELHQQMTDLKFSLKHSLDSFQKLKAEVTELQLKEQKIRKITSISTQTESKVSALMEQQKLSQEDTEDEEYLSTCNNDSLNAKSSLDLINDKLENVYQLLKKRRDGLQKCDTELTLSSKNKSVKERRHGDISNKNEGRMNSETTKTSISDQIKIEDEENEYNYIKPFEEGNRSWIQVERILKKIKKPRKLNSNECTQTVENNNVSTNESQESGKNGRSFNFLQNKLVQKNNFFKEAEGNQYDEDRLLEELFYSDQSANLRFDCKLEGKKSKTHY